MKQIHGGVTAAPGFKAAGVHAGLKDSHQKDFAIILSDSQATAAGVFTQNRVCAAPVTLCRDVLNTDRESRAGTRAHRLGCIGGRGRGMGATGSSVRATGRSVRA